MTTAPPTLAADVDQTLIAAGYPVGAGDDEWSVCVDLNGGVELATSSEVIFVHPNGTFEVENPGEPITSDHERIVALTRACIAGGWRREVALLGIVPELGPMLAWIDSQGLEGYVGAGKGEPYAIIYQPGEGFDDVHPTHRPTPEEALAKCLLKAAHAAAPEIGGEDA
jgi:hypothetical protein